MPGRQRNGRRRGGKGGTLDESGKGRDSGPTLDEGVEGGVEAEVGKTLKLEAGEEVGADNPNPIGGVNANVGCFEEEVGEVNAIATIDLGFHKRTVHGKQADKAITVGLESDGDHEDGGEGAEGVVAKEGAEKEGWCIGRVDCGGAKKVELLVGREVDDST
jgi:hypothetical protein